MKGDTHGVLTSNVKASVLLFDSFARFELDFSVARAFGDQVSETLAFPSPDVFLQSHVVTRAKFYNRLRALRARETERDGHTLGSTRRPTGLRQQA